MTSLPAFDAARAFELLRYQVALGPRAPGTPPHEELIRFLREELLLYTRDVRLQRFPMDLLPRAFECCNVIARIEAAGAPGSAGPILVGTHFDTRWIADREDTYARQYAPIPGANDGASGTAIMLEMARLLASHPPSVDVILAFFDAEDVGDLNYHDYYEGSSWFAAHMGGEAPSEAVILDMVGGRSFNPDFELNSMYFFSERELADNPLRRLLESAARLGERRFFADKAQKYKFIGCDHIPFLDRGIPAAVLIDLDYPQWHTQDDTPEHCSAETLEMVGRIVLDYLRARQEEPLR